MKRCSVGGQAVMEGVMMRTPEGAVALAVRKADGTIVTEYTREKAKSDHPALKWPVVRGVVAFVDSLSVGMKMTTRSAELYGEGIEEEPSRFEKWLAGKDRQCQHGRCNWRCGGSCGCARGRPLRIFAFADNAADLLEGSDPAYLEEPDGRVCAPHHLSGVHHRYRADEGYPPRVYVPRCGAQDHRLLRA